MQIHIRAFEPDIRGEVGMQSSACIQLLEKYMRDQSISWDNVLSASFFLSATTHNLLSSQIEEIKNILPEGMKDSVPLAFLAQPPAGGEHVTMEIHLVDLTPDLKVRIGYAGGELYKVYETGKDSKLLSANGIGDNLHDQPVSVKAEKVFEIMQSILDAEGMEFNHIFRQWNYIEDITLTEQHAGKIEQHYQHFNNVRSNYYATSDFKGGFPAATGIGTKAGGVCVSFYAASGNIFRMYSIENPLQRSAFDYTKEVLVGNAEYKGFTDCTPKFSRARMLQNNTSKQVFISGTASIRDEVTLGEGDVAEQTRITLENIRHLVKAETLSNIENTGPNCMSNLEYFRVYIKNANDYQAVKEVCTKEYPHVRALYVISDVCRDNLLVEIEAIASVVG